MKINYSTRDCSAFQKVVIDGQSPSDVAKSLGIDVNVLYLAKSRILARLREEFGDVIGEDVIGEDVIGEDVIGEDVIGEDVIGEDVIGEDVIGEDVIAR